MIFNCRVFPYVSIFLYLSIYLLTSKNLVGFSCKDLGLRRILNSHPVQLLTHNYRFWTNQPGVKSRHGVRLTSKGKTVAIPAENYLIGKNGAYHPYIDGFARVFFSKTPAQIRRILDNMRDDHALHGMSFQQKDPETGKYDKVFKPQVDGFAPMRKTQYNALVDSTGPTMRAYRWLLQHIYSSREPDVEQMCREIGLDHQEGKEALADIIRIVRSNIYYEGKLIHSDMIHFPFLTVGGFDAVVGSLVKVISVFFEANLGTSSGLSNNIQLFESLRKNFPELYKIIRDRLPEDNTFALLKRAIESNAVSWTRNHEGISVILGPGVGNGAHPDVAAIALFSGMPLVKMSDMYIDISGNVRLNTGKGKKNPVVTGIYARMEESSILQSNNKGIAYRVPNTEKDVELGQKIGLDIQPGVAYAKTGKSDGEQRAGKGGGEQRGFVIGPNGNPLVVLNLDKLGRDPERPNLLPGDLIDAVHNRKLYISNVGGRAVDDKRIFEAIAQYIAPYFVRGNELIAEPPPTLTTKEDYDTFFESNAEQLKGYVVKIPDSSGGDGVDLLINQPGQKRLLVRDMVRNDYENTSGPNRFIIQKLADLTAINSVEEGMFGGYKFGTVAGDVRIFTMMDADGNVFAGPHSILIRTAKVGSASTNTSQGGGYAVGIILSDEPITSPAPARVILPAPASHGLVGINRQIVIEKMTLQCLYLSNELTQGKDKEQLVRSAERLVEMHQDSMDLLGRKFSPFMTYTRRFIKDKISEQQYLAYLQEFIKQLRAATFPVSGGVSDIVNQALDSGRKRPLKENYKEEDGPWYFHFVMTMEEFSQLVTLDMYQNPLLVREFTRGDEKFNKYEGGIYSDCQDPIINGMIRQVVNDGGEVRYIFAENATTGSRDDRPQKPYARINEETGNYIIGIDLRQPNALAAMRHELSHYEEWKEIRDNYMSKGVSFKEAGLMANSDVLGSSSRVAGETRALELEMDAENLDNPFNGHIVARDTQEHQRHYNSRMLYPVIEGLRDILHKEKWDHKKGLIQKLDKGLLARHFMEDMILSTLAVRKRAMNYHLRRIESFTGRESLTFEQQKELQKAIEDFNYFQTTSVFNLIFHSSMLDRFNLDETMGRLNDLFWEVYLRIDTRPFYFDVQDNPSISGGARILSIERQNELQLYQTKVYQGISKKALQQQ